MIGDHHLAGALPPPESDGLAPDPLSGIAVDANELIRMIQSGSGTDLNRLVTAALTEAKPEPQPAQEQTGGPMKLDIASETDAKPTRTAA